jgi:hypothetical protein
MFQTLENHRKVTEKCGDHLRYFTLTCVQDILGRLTFPRKVLDFQEIIFACKGSQNQIR